MMGRIAALALVLAGLAGGGAMYYFQVYAYYDRLEPRISLIAEAPEGVTRLTIAGFEGIDSDSSPLRYRACFEVLDEPVDLIPYPDPQPLNAPRWFGCFDAGRLETDLAAGRAQAWLVEANFQYGFDRVMALYPDGNAFLWHQMNTCGAAHFDGRALPQGCPPAPES
jgi:hypothetical protein